MPSHVPTSSRFNFTRTIMIAILPWVVIIEAIKSHALWEFSFQGWQVTGRGGREGRGGGEEGDCVWRIFVKIMTKKTKRETFSKH